MTTYALHAHDLDTTRSTGIARYALGLGAALEPLLDAHERAMLVTARNNGEASSPHTVIPLPRKLVYGAWLRLRVPRFEWLVTDADLLHATAPIVPTPTKKPLVVTVHDLTPMTHPEWYSTRAAAYFRASIDWVRRSADAVIVPSQFVGDQVSAELSIPAEQITVTGEGFDADHFACADPGRLLDELQLADEPYLLYVGALSTRKGLVPVIEALSEDGPLLVLAGPDGLGAEAVHEAASRRAGKVRLLGRVTDEQLGALLHGALALVHPSAFEGFGLTVLEAMSVGTPVIVSSAGALPEVVGSSGLIVPGEGREAWAHALEVVRDGEELGRMKVAGLRQAQEWSWDVAARKTLQVYREVLNR